MFPSGCERAWPSWTAGLLWGLGVLVGLGPTAAGEEAAVSSAPLAEAPIVATATPTVAAPVVETAGVATVGPVAATGEAGEARLSLSYRRVPLSRVLDQISRASGGLNIQVRANEAVDEEDLKRLLVTVELTNVTWRTAVDYIASKYRFVVNDSAKAEGIILLERPPRITMSVQNAPIESVIKLIAAESGANVIIGPEVTGNVSFDVHDVPWEDALDSLLKAQGFIKVQEVSGILRITTTERVASQLEIRAVPLKYVTPEGAHFQPTIQSEFVSRRSSGTTGEGQEQSLLNVLNQLKSPDGSITFEARSNMLIIKDTATKIEQMIELVRQVDVAPRQVKIETRLLTHRLNPLLAYGVNWENGLRARVDGGSTWSTTWPFTKNTFGHLGSVLKANTSGFEGPTAPTSRNYGIVDPKEVPVTPYTMGTVDFSALDFYVQALATNSEVKIIQAPQLTALDNQEATVFIGGVERYAVRTVQQTDYGSAEGVEITEYMVGVQLMVVPHICGDTDNIILEVVPKEEEDPEVVSRQAGGFTVDVPNTRTKLVHTRMMVRSGDTAVIAGLMKNREDKSSTKVPWVADMPVLGHLFKHQSKAEDCEHSLILITPTIIKSEDKDFFRNELDSIRDRVSSTGMGELLNSNGKCSTEECKTGGKLDFLRRDRGTCSTCGEAAPACGCSPKP